MVKDNRALRHPGVFFRTVAKCISKEREICLAFSPLTEDKSSLSKSLLRKTKKVQPVTPTLFFLKGNYEKDLQSNLCGGQPFSSKLRGAYSYAFSSYIVCELFTQCPTLTRHRSPGWGASALQTRKYISIVHSPPVML